jgi:hypothetical protein
MPYNSKIHNRKSIRLKGYDYSQAGLYFVTICCQSMGHLFREINNGIMALNDSGKVIEKWYYELKNKFHDKNCHEFIIIPALFHITTFNRTNLVVICILCNNSL